MILCNQKLLSFKGQQSPTGLCPLHRTEKTIIQIDTVNVFILLLILEVKTVPRCFACLFWEHVAFDYEVYQWILSSLLVSRYHFGQWDIGVDKHFFITHREPTVKRSMTQKVYGWFRTKVKTELQEDIFRKFKVFYWKQQMWSQTQMQVCS